MGLGSSVSGVRPVPGRSKKPVSFRSYLWFPPLNLQTRE